MGIRPKYTTPVLSRWFRSQSSIKLYLAFSHRHFSKHPAIDAIPFWDGLGHTRQIQFSHLLPSPLLKPVCPFVKVEKLACINLILQYRKMGGQNGIKFFMYFIRIMGQQEHFLNVLIKLSAFKIALKRSKSMIKKQQITIIPYSLFL